MNCAMAEVIEPDYFPANFSLLREVPCIVYIRRRCLADEKVCTHWALVLPVWLEIVTGGANQAEKT